MNRIISLVIGFIVLILIFVWIAGRFRATTRTTANAPTPTITASPTPTGAQEDKGWNPLGFLFDKDPTATPTRAAGGNLIPTSMIISPTTQAAPQQAAQPTTSTITYRNNQTNQTATATITTAPQQIPATGVSTAFIPAIISACVAGMYLHRKSS
ncbi:MAG: hypothetical protein ACEQSA_03565 [Weeksellaceae bacterium]